MTMSDGFLKQNESLNFYLICIQLCVCSMVAVLEEILSCPEDVLIFILSSSQLQVIHASSYTRVRNRADIFFSKQSSN